MLLSVLAKNNFSCKSCVKVPDVLDEATAAISRAIEESDVVLITGGVSVGKYDLVEEAISKAGGTIVYHGVGIKPGKPQLFAVFPEKKYVFGLPGNPLSAMVGMQEFALPALWRLAGMPAENCRRLLRLPLTSAVRSKGERVQLHLARLVMNDRGSCVEPIPTAGSADLVAAGKADGVIMMPAGIKQIEESETVDFRPWVGA
jgi:molybdopterin molybdotransferase